MKKVTTLTLAGLMAVTAGAQASASRWNGFGEANAYIADVQDIWTLPGVIASHANTTYFEFGKTAAVTTSGTPNANDLPNGTWGGSHSALGGGVLGIWLGRSANELDGVYSAMPNVDDSTTGSLTAANLSNVGIGGLTANNLLNSARTQFPEGRVDILYGFNLNDDVTLGFGVNRAAAGKSGDIDNGGNKDKGSVDFSNIGISLGAELKNVGPASLLELGLQWNSESATLAYTAAGGTEDKVTLVGSAIAFRAGADMTGEKGAFSRAELGLNTVSGEGKANVGGTVIGGEKNNSLGYKLGYACGMSGDKGMGLGGLMLIGNSTNNEDIVTSGTAPKSGSSSMVLQVSSAGEMKLKDWLQTRAGISGNIWDSSATSSDNGAATPTKKTTSTTKGSKAVLTAGLSLLLGDVVIDGVLNQDVLYTGGYLFSGVAETISSQVSATWAWGGAKN
jgi:hypothetical protein